MYGAYERYATIDDVKNCKVPTPAALDDARQRWHRVWGPVLKPAAQAVGALVGACSVCVKVNLAVQGPDGEALNSADIGSYVLIYTMGNAPMDFKLSFPPRSKRRAERAEYEVHPLFTIRLSHGSLFIFSPLDDIFFCHEACFPDDAVGYRYALVFRWHSLQAQFFVHNNCMKLSAAQRAQQEQREREKRAKKKRARDDSLRGPFG